MKENIISLSGWSAWQGRAVQVSSRVIQHLPGARQLVGVLARIRNSQRGFFCVRIEQGGETLCSVSPMACAEVCGLSDTALQDWAELQILRFQASNQPEAAFAVAA